MGLGSSRGAETEGEEDETTGAASSDVFEPAAKAANIFRGEIGEGRMPGLIPFTTIEYEEALADRLYDAALIHGWLSCIDRINTMRRERWCAIHENVRQFCPCQSVAFAQRCGDQSDV